MGAGNGQMRGGYLVHVCEKSYLLTSSSSPTAPSGSCEGSISMGIICTVRFLMRRLITLRIVPSSRVSSYSSISSSTSSSPSAVNNNNNIRNLYCAVPILIYSTAHYTMTYILFPLALAELPIGTQGINSCQVPIY